jgi:MFS family permease
MDARLLHTSELRGRTPGALREGLRYVGSQPKMLMILVLVFFAGTFGMNFQITSALMATQVYGKGASEFGILGSAVAIGSLTGALLNARRPRIRLRLLVAAAVGFGLAEIVAGLLPTYLSFAVFAPVIGLCTITLLNSANATMQMESDPALRGRVMALYMTVVMGGTPLGAPVIGLIGEQLGARWTLIIGGAMVLVGVGVALLVFDRLRGRTAPEAASAQAEPVAA